MLVENAGSQQLPKSSGIGGYSSGRIELTSAGRGWDNLLVTRVVHEVSYLDSSPQPASPDHCLLMVDAGRLKGKIRHNQGWYRPCNLAKGDWVIAPAYENEIDVFGDVILDGEQKFATLAIYLSPKLLAKVAEETAGTDRNRIELRHHLNVRDPMMTQIADVLKNQLYRADAYGKVYAETAAQLMAAHLLQNYSVNGAVLCEVKGRLGRRMASVVEYIRENLREDLSIESMAKVAHMSPYYFIKCFKNQVGKTPYQFMLQLRMERAKYLLKSTDKPVLEIASETGYGYACNFSNAFKQHTGMTPNTYRKMR